MIYVMPTTLLQEMRGLKRRFSMVAKEVLRRLAVSAGIGGVLVVLGFGAYSFVQSGQRLSGWILTLSILFGAVAFVAASTYMDREGWHYRSCLLSGAVTAVSVTALSLAVAVSVVFVSEAGVTSRMLSYLLLAFALSIVFSSSALLVIKDRRNRQQPVY